MEYRPKRCKFAGEITVNGRNLMRSFSLAGYSLLLTSKIVDGGGRSTSCMNGESDYLNRKGFQRKCLWLTGMETITTAMARKQDIGKRRIVGLRGLVMTLPSWDGSAFGVAGSTMSVGDEDLSKEVASDIGR